MSSKSILTILTEAIIIGILFVVIFQILKIKLYYYDINLNLFLSAFIFHILCEMMGINIWYSKNYVNILSNNNISIK